MQYYDTIIEYGRKLINSELELMGRSRIYYRVNDTCYATRKGAYFPTLNENDISDISSTADFIKASLVRTGYNAAIECKPEYIGKCIESELSLPSVLDDSAMIVGKEARLVNLNRKEIASAVRYSSAVLIRGGSAVVFGRTLNEAYTTLEVLEKNAKIFIKGEVLGGAKPVGLANAVIERLVYELKYSTKENRKHLEAEGLIKPKKESKLKKSFDEFVEEVKESGASESALSNESEASGDNNKRIKHAGKASNAVPAADPAAVYYNPREYELRKTIVDYGLKLMEENLVKGTWGNLSVRLDDEYMLCTPSGLAYVDLRPEDIVKVNIETLEYEGDIKPTSEKKFHAGIYQQHPSANAVVHTHSTYSCVFASAGKAMSLKSHLIKNTALIKNLGLSVPCAGYGLAGTDKLTRNVLSALSDSVACFMKHHGMVCYGSDMESAFNRAKLIEETAKQQINRKYYKGR